jgi:heme exporter protein D
MTPQFESLNDLVNMGGYGPYVWSSWGLSFFIILFLTIRSIQHYQSTIKRLSALEQANANEQKN